jgi:hypothetical protein
MTHEQVIQALIERDVAKWGEQERIPSERARRRHYPTIGLALNCLAHYDVLNIDEAMAAEAKRIMTPADWLALKGW